MSDDAGMYDSTDIPDGSEAGDTTYAEEPTYEVYDTDNDGVVDLEVWSFPDGSWQVLADTDGNLAADTLAIDVDGDGVADIQVQITADGTYFVQWDTDLDGNIDLEQEFSRTELEDVLPGAADLLDTQYSSGGETTPASYPEEGAEPADESGAETTGDAEYEAIDTDGDGAVDAEQWVFPDGSWQVLADTDGDTQADLLAVDTNGDNEPDLYITLNADGTYSAEWDSDFDGVFESQQDFTRAELEETIPGAAELLDTRYAEGEAAGESSGEASGEPAADAPGGEGTNVNVGAEEAGGTAAAEYGAYDDDGDGVTDFEQWVFPDGTWQVLQDTDFDLQPDQLAVDSNGDGEADLVVNLNADGSYTVQYDQDGDGVFEVNEDFTREELDQVLPGVSDSFDTPYGQTPDAPLGDLGAGSSNAPEGGTNAMAGSEGNTGSTGTEGTGTEGTGTEGAGEAEYSATDTDGDGVVDLEQWVFPDGSWTVLADTDGDYAADTLGIDTDGDGEVDIIVKETGDGNYNLQWDQDGDGYFEVDEAFTRDDLESVLPGVADALEFQYEGVPATEVAGETVPASNETPEQLPEPETEPAPEPEPAPETGDVVYETADTDGDGLIDAEAWTFADGTWQILTDSDLDGQADMLFIDTDGDDQADVQVCVNADGSYQVQYDQDGDGVFEVDQAFTRAELDELLPGVTDLLDTNYSGTGA